MTAYIALGSNIAPTENIPRALEALAQAVSLEQVSTLFWTEALGRIPQPDFLNGVCKISTVLPARGLKYDVLRGIEKDLGRVRTEGRWAFRPIDLDIVLYGELVIDEPGLRIPDPDIRVRPFVAVPLLELAPGLVLPDTGERIEDIVDKLDTQSLRPAGGQESLLRPDSMRRKTHGDS